MNSSQASGFSGLCFPSRAHGLKPPFGDSGDNRASCARIHNLGNVGNASIRIQGAPDEVKPFNMFVVEGHVAASTGAPSRRLQQAAIPIEPHVVNGQARRPSQLENSERPRSHLPPKHVHSARTGQVRYSWSGKHWWKAGMSHQYSIIPSRKPVG